MTINQHACDVADTRGRLACVGVVSFPDLSGGRSGNETSVGAYTVQRNTYSGTPPYRHP